MIEHVCPYCDGRFGDDLFPLEKPEPTLDEQQKAIKDKVAAAVEAGFDDRIIAQINKKLHDAYCDIQGSIEWELKSDIASNLASHISDYAQRTVEAILAGNEGETRRYLQCTLGPYNYNGRDRDLAWPYGIEPGPIELRRKLVEAFAELLKTERILDLEAIIKSREKQIADLHGQVAKLKERLQSYDCYQAP